MVNRRSYQHLRALLGHVGKRCLQSVGSLRSWLLAPKVLSPDDLTLNVPYRTGTMTTWTPPDSAKPYLATISSVESRYGMPRYLLARLLYQESRFRPEIIDGRIKSGAGAMGIAQVLPLTAKDPGFGVAPLTDPLNPFEAIPWAGSYLSALRRYTGSWDRALAAYNWGAGSVKTAVQNYGEDWLNVAPLETRNYVTQISADVPGVV